MDTRDLLKNPLLKRAFDIKSKEEAKDVYQDWATTYEDTMLGKLNYTSHATVAEILSKHLENRDGSIVDLGCGTGLVGGELKKHGFANVDGVDFSEQMLAEAGKLGIYRKLLQEDLTVRTSIDSNTYDAATCAGTFTCGHLDASCLEEVFRLLKVDGLLACAVREQIWQDMGFDKKFEQMIADEKIKILFKENLANYEGSRDKDGIYMIVQKL